jgi:lipopolysaccharide/colanic/teichoic acid biosynthesis glycosyltransferase
MPFPGRSPSPRLEPVEQLPLPQSPDARPRSLVVKHTLDRVGAVVALAVVAPLFLATAIGLKLFTPGTVFVRERRISRDGRSFQLLGFQPLPFLRRWSIDQMPQLVNVLRGEMSFVGPRPERPEFVELFGANLRRHDGPRRVRPGIAGWSQLHGLSGRAPLVERVQWDDWYVENWSLWLDAKIVLLTVRDVCRGAHLANAD